MLARVEDGLPTPQLDDAPQVPSTLLWVVSDFHSLESERSIGMGFGPIPITSMYSFLEATETPREMWEECIAYWTAMDGETLRNQAERMQKSAPSAKGEQSVGGRSVPRDQYPEG